MPAAEVEAALVAGAPQDLLEDVRLFDVYTGAQVGEGHESLAYTLSSVPLTGRSPRRRSRPPATRRSPKPTAGLAPSCAAASASRYRGSRLRAWTAAIYDQA